MKVAFACLFTLVPLAAMLLPAGARAEDAAKTPQARRLIVIIGASTASGTGADPVSRSFARRYAAYVGKLSPAYRVVNLAVGGYNSYQFLPNGQDPSPHFHPDPEHNITKALSLHPDAIILSMPTNDVAARIPPADVERNLLTIAEEAYRARIAFWITTVAPRNLDAAGRKDIADLNDWIRKQFGRTAIDFNTGLGAPDGSILPQFGAGDGIHLNNAGHALLYERLLVTPITLP